VKELVGGEEEVDFFPLNQWDPVLSYM